MEIDQRDSDQEGSMSPTDLSEAEDESQQSTAAHTSASQLIHPMGQDREDLKVGLMGWGAGVYLPPPAMPPPPPPAAMASSASSHSSDSPMTSHHAWSFEEQFKQLYELNGDPKRKEFLDDLFSFMQQRGTPINRLPIMAKSVLDLYELYNLVIQRGGLVDVINKKLWQEIIKGLHLPSSITSAAFTLRTQYMKYLYPYECKKEGLSSPSELQAAIDGNRREGRRGSYSAYTEATQHSLLQQTSLMQPSLMQQSGLMQQSSPLSLVHRPTSAPPPSATNSKQLHVNNNHISVGQGSLLPPPQPTGTPKFPPVEFETRMLDYVKLLNKEICNTTPIPHQPNSPPLSPPELGNLNPLEVQRLSLWNLYHGGGAPSPEPQKEALNLEKKADQPPSEGASSPDVPTRRHPEPEDIKLTGTHIEISSKGIKGSSENSLLVSMDINGTMYQGVLFAQSTRSN